MRRVLAWLTGTVLAAVIVSAQTSPEPDQTKPSFRTVVLEAGEAIEAPAVVRDIIPLDADPADIQFRRQPVDLPTARRSGSTYLVVRWEFGAADTTTFFIEPTRPLTNANLIIPARGRLVLENGRALVTVER